MGAMCCNYFGEPTTLPTLDTTQGGGDGKADFLIGAPGANGTGGTDSGKAYLVFGASSISGGSLDSVATVLNGEAASDAFGQSVGGGGDLRPDTIDGLSDLLIGAYKARPDSLTDAGYAYVVKGTNSSAPASSSYKARSLPGDSPVFGIGQVANSVPNSRCWIDFESGSDGNGASQETVTITRSKSGITISEVDSSIIADVHWAVSTTRTPVTNATLTFKYLPSEVVNIPSFNGENLRLYYSASLTSGWTQAGSQSVDILKAEISGSVPSLGSTDTYFAMAASGTPGTLQSIHVYPGGSRTIQQAVLDVAAGGTVIVHPGVYLENIEFPGGDIVLRSENPDSPSCVSNTVIDGQHQGSVIILTGEETESCLVEGLTIVNGSGYTQGQNVFGGGILGSYSLATIQNNVIRNNDTTLFPGTNGFGGGLAFCDGLIRNNQVLSNKSTAGGGLYACNGQIDNNKIANNTSKVDGGGLAWCDGTITNNLIEYNSAEDATAGGGGLCYCSATIEKNIVRFNDTIGYGGGLLFCFDKIVNNIIYGNHADINGGGLMQCNALIYNNTIMSNAATGFDTQGTGGVAFCNSSQTGGREDLSGIVSSIINCIIWDNWQAFQGSSSQIDGDSALPTFCCIQNYGENSDYNIDSDPLLLFPEVGRFNLEAQSPCIDAGTAITGIIDDYEGDIRPFEQSQIDIGADEYSGIYVPARPTGLIVTQGAYVQLDWDDSSEVDFIGYNVYRSENISGPFSRINQEIILESDYTDGTAQNNTFYYYAITTAIENEDQFQFTGFSGSDSGSSGSESGSSNKATTKYPSNPYSNSHVWIIVIDGRDAVPPNWPQTTPLNYDPDPAPKEELNDPSGMSRLAFLLSHLTSYPLVNWYAQQFDVQNDFKVFHYPETAVNADGSGRIYNDIKDALFQNRAHHFVLISFSWGSASLYQLCDRLRSQHLTGELINENISIPFTAYVDGITKDP